MRFALITILLVSLCVAGNALGEETVFGKPLTLSEPNVISAINTTPAEFADKDVLVTGKVIDMCRHSGCWVTIEAEDKAQVLCRSLDESVKFTPAVLGQRIRLQGNLKFDKNAPGEVMKAHEGEEAHACPNPQVMVAIHGAVVDLAVAAPAAEGEVVPTPEAVPAPQTEPEKATEATPEAAPEAEQKAQ